MDPTGCCVAYQPSYSPWARLVALVQIYKAEEPHWPVRVYNLLYEDSQEADKFAAAVAREVTPFLRFLARQQF